MHTYEHAFLMAWAITVGIETTVLLLLNKWQKNATMSDVLFAGIISSSLTIPYLWFVMPIFFDSRTAYVFISEGLIVVVEGLLLYKLLSLSLARALAASFIANMVSIAVGFLR